MKDIQCLERVQKSATNLIPALKKYSYTDRLKKLDLLHCKQEESEATWSRGPILKSSYKIMTGKDKIDRGAVLSCLFMSFFLCLWTNTQLLLVPNAFSSCGRCAVKYVAHSTTTPSLRSSMPLLRVAWTTVVVYSSAHRRKPRTSYSGSSTPQCVWSGVEHSQVWQRPDAHSA